MLFTPTACRSALLGLLAGFCLLTAQAQHTTAQPPAVKFGQVTAADFTQQPVPADTTAEAVVLYESVNTRFSFRANQLLRTSEYYSRIRINKKSAYDRATVEIPLRGAGSARESLGSVEGVTYTLQNGQVMKQKMDKAAVVSERISDSYVMQKLTLPGVQEGCIVEYRYTQFSPEEATPPSWGFQQDVPVVWSDYKVTISNYYYFKVIMTGYLGLAVYDQKPVGSNLIPGQSDEGAVEWHYAVANAPAFKNEPYITTPIDYLSRIQFELASVNIPGLYHKSFSLSWQDMDQTLLNMTSFGGQYKKAPYWRAVAESINAKYPATDTLSRVKAAYDHVRNTMTWNGQGNMESDRLKKVLEIKKGDAADLNFMLIGLLRELNLDANPVILSTRTNGQINENYGLLRQFNYVVAHLTLGGADFMLDATDRFVRPGMLPHRALNRVGRLILPDNKSRFVSLLPTERDVESKIGQFTLSDDGELTGTLAHSYGGYGAVDARESYQERGEEKFVEEVRRKKPGWQIEKAEFENGTNLSQSMTVKYKLTIPEGAQVVGDRIYLRPLCTEDAQENPFKQPDRQFPVDFAYAFDESFIATYTLPAGYVADELPKPLVLSLPQNGGRFTYQVQQTGNQLAVVSRISLRKSLYTAEEYPFLKEFYEKILLKNAEQVVLKKGPTVAEKK